MKNFIEELYYGNINPQERYFDRNSETGKSILTIADVEDSLNGVLNDKEKEHFKEYQRLDGEITADSNLDSFIVSFRMGAKLALDTYISDNAPYHSVENKCTDYFREYRGSEFLKC